MAVRSGPFLGAPVRAATHEAPPCLCTPICPPLLSLLRTIPLHVVRRRIRSFSSCEGTTSGITILSSVCLFLSSRLSSPRFFLVSFFTWDSPSSAHLPCCSSRHISVVATFSLCVHHVLSRVSLQTSSIQVGLSRLKFVWQQFERHDSQHASKPLRVHRGPVTGRTCHSSPMPLRGNVRAFWAVFGGALL